VAILLLPPRQLYCFLNVFFRTFFQDTNKELLPWLLAEKPATVISITDNTDIPEILISAKKKGITLFLLNLVILLSLVFHFV